MNGLSPLWSVEGVNCHSCGQWQVLFIDLLLCSRPVSCIDCLIGTFAELIRPRVIAMCVENVCTYMCVHGGCVCVCVCMVGVCVCVHNFTLLVLTWVFVWTHWR